MVGLPWLRGPVWLGSKAFTQGPWESVPTPSQASVVFSVVSVRSLPTGPLRLAWPLCPALLSTFPLTVAKPFPWQGTVSFLNRLPACLSLESVEHPLGIPGQQGGVRAPQDTGKPALVSASVWPLPALPPRLSTC